MYEIQIDLEDPIYYTGSNSPQITISPDFTYTGIEGCALISGDFFLGNGNEYFDFILHSRNYETDESDCLPGSKEYAMWVLGTDTPLGVNLYAGNDGIEYLEYKFDAGFISYFSNQLLSVNENNFSDLVIFPNPAKNKVTIQSATNNFDSISIKDINGRIIISSENVVSNEIDVSALKSGMYFITLASSNGNVTRKFIKK